MQSTTVEAAPKVRKLPPPPFAVAGRNVKWSKVEDGFYFAEFVAGPHQVRLIARFPDPRVTFKENGTGRIFDEQGFDLQACAARAVARFRAYFDAPDTVRPNVVTLTKRDAKTIRELAKIAAKERSRFAFNAVQVAGGTATATDGKRAHLAELEGRADGGSRLIPRAEAAKAEAGDFAFSAFDGAWPNHAFLGNLAHGVTVTAPRAAVLRALDEAQAAANKFSPCARLYVEAERVRVVVTGLDGDELETSFPAVVKGPACMIAFNPKFLGNAVRFCAPTVAAHEVRFGLDEERREPARVQAAKRNGRTAYVMPVTVKA